MAPTFPLFPSSPASAMQGVRSIDKEKEKGVNVQVLVRCRPLNEDELRSNAPQVLSCNDQRREVSVNLNNASKQIDRAFTFDKVFGPQAQQKELYEQAVSPIVNEVLEGFNCTIFAYGQTGTGKTYTMEGSSGMKPCIINGGMPSDAGVIPRAIQQIVDTLQSQNAEYSMKVTFLELYNEEIMDLLAPSEEAAPRPADDRQRKPLTLMEDGKGGVLVRGLEEEIVYSAKEIYNLLERGSAKRRTAETLLNKQSSRSHSIFSVTIHVKEATPEGEELVKCGKLNLVDLAGSENISRSGARDSRAREAGEINKSLLTLGRVITSLVEHLGHIPYRDSKLTRVLRDSLGGKTKTCIIATVSPSVHCLEETLSTLDYAHRAKNIKNKPEVNQKMMKSAFIKDLYGEIEKLKAEVYAAREKNGVYLPRERYLQEEAERKAMSQRIEHMELEFEAKGKQMDNLQEALDMERQQCADLAIKLENNQRKLDQTLEALADGKERLKQAQYTIKERDFIIAKFQYSETALFKQAGSLQSNLESSVNDIAGLYLKIDRKNKLETDNLNLVRMFHGELGQQLTVLRDFVTCSVEEQQQQFHNMEEYIRTFLVTKNQATDTVKGRVLNMKDMFSSGLKHIYDLVRTHEKDSTSTFQNLNVTISAHASALEELLSTSVLEAEEVFQDLRKALSMHQAAISSLVCQQQEVAQKSMNASREVSLQVENFFQLLERYTAEISRGVIDSHQDLLENLTELEDTYEEKSKQEERMLIEKIAEIVAAATARKSEIVNSKIKSVRKSSNEHSSNLQQSMVNIQEATSQSQSQWKAYMEQAQGDFCEASASLVTEHKCLEGIERNCEKSVAKAREGWKRTQDLVQHFEKNNLLAVDLVVKEGIYGNGLLLSNLKELNDSAQSDFQTGYGAAMESIDRCIDADKDATTLMLSTMATQRHTLEELQSFHTSGTGDIDIRSDHCFNHEYLEDKPTCTTPRKRLIEVPSKVSIEVLCAPSIESLTQEFKEGSDKGQQHQGTMPVMMESKIPNFVESSLLLIKDNRVPLTMVN